MGLLQIHDRDRTADRENRNGGVEPQLAGMTFRRACQRDEGADLQSALPGFAPGLVVLVSEQLVAPVGEKFLEEGSIPRLVDLSRVGCRGPVRDPTRADYSDTLGPGSTGTPQSAAKLITALERNERRSLAVDIDRNDREVGARGEEVQRHHEAVIELPLLRIRQV